MAGRSVVVGEVGGDGIPAVAGEDAVEFFFEFVEEKFVRHRWSL